MDGVVLENEYAYIKDSKVFLKSYLGMPDRQIGEVKRTDQEAFDYFVNRYAIALNKVEQLESEIEETENKGSFLTKLLQLRKRLLNFDGIGDFIPLLGRLDSQEKYLRGLINGNQSNNLTIKEGLIAEARELIASKPDADLNAIIDDLQEIKIRWIRTGPVEKEQQDISETDFRETLDVYYARKKIYYEEQTRVITERIDKYESIISEAKKLRHMENMDEGFVELKRIQATWREVGLVPPKKFVHQLKFFKKITTEFYEKYCEYKGFPPPQKRIDPRVTQQMAMTDEVEKLTKNKDIFSAAERTKVLLNDWKGIKVPPQLADKTVQERFRNACDKIFELSYLMKVLSRKYPNFDYLTEMQQHQVKYHEMDNIVNRSRSELNLLIDSSGMLTGNFDADRITQNNLNTQKRKMAMKETILNELSALV